jgi:3-dehydroquinate synthase
LWQEFLQAKLERGSTVIALGGGVVGDLAGFAAATYLRGVPWIVVPTSLLAMVDSSLGGKTGIDLPQGKNLVGAFHPPRLVWVDPQVLDTLPEVEFQSGLAEVVKAGIIDDPHLFSLCAQGWETVNQQRDQLVNRAIAVKIGVIESDPYEKGRRAILNLGHTIGHALELVSHFRLSHGQAVAIGMVVETYLAEGIGLAQTGLAERIENVLKNLGLPWQVPDDLEIDFIIETMHFDKKRHRDSLRFALPVQLGEIKQGVQVDDKQLLVDVLRTCRYSPK